MSELAPKKGKTDGNVALIDKSISLAAQDPERWIAERRRKWPSKARIAEKMKESPQLSETAKPVEVSNSTETKKSNGEGVAPNGEPQRRKPMCKFFSRGKCNAGEKCRFSHERHKRPKQEPHERIYKRFEAPQRSSSFLKLVQTDQSVQDERFLEFLEYITRTHKI